MRALFTRKLLLAPLIVCMAVFCLFVLNKRLYASDKEAYRKENREVKAEMPWESVMHQFMGAVLFK